MSRLVARLFAPSIPFARLAAARACLADAIGMNGSPLTRAAMASPSADPAPRTANTQRRRSRRAVRAPAFTLGPTVRDAVGRQR